MPGIGTSKMSIPFSRDSQSWESYWATRNFRGVGRSGLTIPDEFGNDASILPSCGLCDENNYLQRTEANLWAGVTAATGGYIERRVYYTGAGTYKVLFSSCDAVGSAQQFNLYINAGKPQIYVLGTGIDNSYKADNALSIGWHVIRFASVAQHYVITVDGDVVPGTITGTDNGKWIGDVTLRDNVNIGYVKRATPFAGSLFYDDYCDFNGTNKWYFSGQGIYEYEVLNNKGFTWTGSAHVFYGNNISNQYLDVGYSLFTKNGAANEYVPYTSTGTPFNVVAVMEGLGYIHWGNIAGDAANYNLAPAMIEFPAVITDYDRSDTTIHKAAARAGSDYDAANPTRWRGVDVANPDIYYSWKNTGYEAKQFAKIDFILAHPIKVYEFITFPVNASAAMKISAESYCNIDDYYDIDIIVMGDKTDSPVEANNTIYNNIVTAQNPDCIIGTGDYDDDTFTMAQLLTGLPAVPKFASPGNHDDWVVGVRTEFNANFHGGGYKKISLPNVDFFLYDAYLKEDESGYYTNTEAEAVLLAARQASTQGLWLIAQLAASTAKFKVVVFHQPAWVSTNPYPAVLPMPAMQWDWAALGVDLIMSGHVHFYDRLIKATGSGNVNVLVTGTSGADQIDIDTPDEDSIVRKYYRAGALGDDYDTDFTAGHLIKMNITRNKLQIDLSGIDTSGNIHTGKDQLVLT